MKKLYYNAYDPFSFISHFIGFILGFIFLFIVIIFHLINDYYFINITGLYFYCISMILLYGASSYYHYLDINDNKKLFSRKLDHSMIYILIAGSYAPICLNYVDLNFGIRFLIIMFSIAFVGIISKIFWLNAPRIFYTSLYLLMGWAIAFDFSSFSNIPNILLFFVALSGTSYSIGAIIYVMKKPNFNKLNFHDVFHIFVLIGTMLQLIAYCYYIL